jgi:hypothetical protein
VKLKKRGGPFKKGVDERRNLSGRPIGSKNKFTTLKQAFLDAFESLGGTDGLTDWAAKGQLTKTEFYKLIARMLPSDVRQENVNPDNKLVITVVKTRGK